MVRALDSNPNRNAKLYPLRDSLGNIVPTERLRSASALDYLEAGEGYIRTHGWNRGDWEDTSSGGSVCALGGILNGAIELQNKLNFPLHLMYNLRSATQALCEAIPAEKRTEASKIASKDSRFWYLDHHERIEFIIAAYNDLPDTTEEDILNMFSAAKEHLVKNPPALDSATATSPIYVKDKEQETEVLAWCEPAVDARISV